MMTRFTAALRSRPGILIAAAAALIAAGGSSIAVASIPNSTTGVFTGCYAKSSGTLRLIDAQAGAKCKTGEKEVSWNRTGPQGPPGPPGADGSQVTVYLAFGPHVTSQPGATDTATAPCRSGDYATGGGDEISFINGLSDKLLFVMESYPAGSGGASTGWTVSVRNTNPDSGGNAETWVPYAECIHGATLGTANG